MAWLGWFFTNVSYKGPSLLSIAVWDKLDCGVGLPRPRVLTKRPEDAFQLEPTAAAVELGSPTGSSIVVMVGPMEWLADDFRVLSRRSFFPLCSELLVVVRPSVLAKERPLIPEFVLLGAFCAFITVIRCGMPRHDTKTSVPSATRTCFCKAICGWREAARGFKLRGKRPVPEGFILGPSETSGALGRDIGGN